MSGRLARGLAIAAAVALVAGPAEARRDRNLSGDVARAARLLGSSRIDEARPQIADLDKRAPTSPEVRWLDAQVAFLDGDYAGALTHLDGLGDDAVDGAVGETRQLASRSRDVTSGFVHVDSAGGHFAIYYQPGPDAVIADLAGEVLESARDAIGDDLGWKPDGKVRVELLGKPSDLARLSTLTESEIETTGTIALSKYEKLMVVSPRATILGYPWMDTLAHEYTHLVIAHVSHDTVPVWMHEGLARFEQTRWRLPASTTGAVLSATDQSLLAGALAKRRLISLDAMYPSMAKLPSQEAAALAYAEVYTLIGWLHTKVGYEGLRQILAAQRDGKSAQRAVAEATGKRWLEVERDWQAHLRSLDLGAGRAVAGHGGRRIRFARGGAGDDNVGLDEVASAKAKKFARLGGMLRAQGQPAAAAIEYEKALAAAGGNEPFVAGKLARTYVELGAFDKAIALARPLLALDEDDPTAAVTLGVALAAEGDHDGARAAFEQALRVSPFDPTVRCGLADSYEHTGDAVRAHRERSACDRLRS
ncbi:MAG TPA: tetratricopeptide repeat protein [Kofleriaceae bacterium]|nr:tetratricopeptide repeat protein [Kofleriaceae bacterium]